MKRAAFAALVLICAVAPGHAQNLSSDDLARRTIERRAVEAVIWGVPAVNTDLMYRAMVRDAKGSWNQIVRESAHSRKRQTQTTGEQINAHANARTAFAELRRAVRAHGGQR
jgi:hypothetical protein